MQFFSLLFTFLSFPSTSIKASPSLPPSLPISKWVSIDALAKGHCCVSSNCSFFTQFSTVICVVSPLSTIFYCEHQFTDLKQGNEFVVGIVIFFSLSISMPNSLLTRNTFHGADCETSQNTNLKNITFSSSNWNNEIINSG